MREICEQVAAKYDVHGIAAVHRVGTLAIGDIAVIVATTTSHRGEAFDASRTLIDTLKAEVPIWKHQRFSDGTEEWVGSP
jgi:molybdopterin synthase catalytic subunit